METVHDRKRHIHADQRHVPEAAHLGRGVVHGREIPATTFLGGSAVGTRDGDQARWHSGIVADLEFPGSRRYSRGALTVPTHAIRRTRTEEP